MRSKGFVTACFVAGLSVMTSMSAFASVWEMQQDGSYKVYDSEKNLNSDSGYYSVSYYRWEQQEDGAWKMHRISDWWQSNCSHMKHIGVDPKESCPGELKHSEEYLRGSAFLKDKWYFFDESGIMAADKWISQAERYTNSWIQTSDKYSVGILEYYDPSGAKVFDAEVNGRRIDKDGIWRDPSIIPLRSDGIVDLSRLDAEGIDFFLFEIKDNYSLDEILERLRNLPEYIGESTNEYGMLQMNFTDPNLKYDVEFLTIINSPEWKEMN